MAAAALAAALAATSPAALAAASPTAVVAPEVASPAASPASGATARRVTTEGVAASTIAGAATTARAAAASGALLGFVVAIVDVDQLLGLALALALGLAGRGTDELVLFLDKRSSGVPLLVLLDALVGPAGLELGLERRLFLGLLDEILVVRDLLLFGFDRLLLGLAALGGVLDGRFVFVLLGDFLTGSLVLQLGIALASAPTVGSLLFRAAAEPY